MTTEIALLANRCGLSNREAAAFLDVRLDTFNSWSSGRNPAKPGPTQELRHLYQTIDRAARQAIATIAEKAPAGSDIELGYCADDYEAQRLGFPFASVHRAMLGIVVAALDGYNVRLSPRGSTIGTAAAMDARERSE